MKRKTNAVVDYERVRAVSFSEVPNLRASEEEMLVQAMKRKIRKKTEKKEKPRV